MLPARKVVTIPVKLRLESSTEQYQQGIIFTVAESSRLTMHPVTIGATVLRASSEVGSRKVQDINLRLGAVEPVGQGNVTGQQLRGARRFSPLSWQVSDRVLT